MRERRCAWCPDPPRRKAARRPNHRICRRCLAAGLRAVRTGYARAGALFRVWDADASDAAAWAGELAKVEEALAASRARSVRG